MSKYLNPYTDFGFKKLFGEEANKDLLTDFLNQILPAHHQIAELHFKNPEQLPDIPLERKAIFDIHCTSTQGEQFIVEMQKAKMNFFKDRSVYYATFPIREQAKKGDWLFKLAPVYFIAILDFEYDEQEEQRKFRRDIALRDQDGDLFFDKLHFKFLQMPLFNKTEAELETRFDQWIYFLKNLESFDHIPAILNEQIFQKAFHTAELANLNQEQYHQYEKNLLDYMSAKAVVLTAWEEGKAEGKAEGLAEGLAAGEQRAKLETAQKMRELGFSEAQITTLTGLAAGSF